MSNRSSLSELFSAEKEKKTSFDFQRKGGDEFRRMKFLTQLRLEIEKYRILYKNDSRAKQLFREVDELFLSLADKEIKTIEKEVQLKLKELSEISKKTDSNTFDDRKKKEKHHPLDTVNFLAQFSSDPILKIATHDWDKAAAFIYSEWIKEAKSRFFLIRRKNQGVPTPTFAKTRAFLLASDFDENDKSWWGFGNIKMGWSSPELVRWCKENPGIYPKRMEIPSRKNRYQSEEGRELSLTYFEDVIKKFKYEIQFRNEKKHLLDFLERKMRNWGVNKAHEVEFDKKSLTGLSFFVDIDRFSSGLYQIFEPLKERTENPIVRFSAVERRPCVELKLLHVGSKITREYHDAKFQRSTTSGNFQSALKNLIGQCDWSMEGVFKNGETKKINFLTKDEKPSIENSTFSDGVLHTFTFYKPTLNQ